MKKVPPDADFLRLIWRNLNVAELQSHPIHIALIWAGLLLAFFFCLRISELLNPTPRDIKFTDDDQGMSSQFSFGPLRLIKKRKAQRAPSGLTPPNCARCKH